MAFTSYTSFGTSLSGWLLDNNSATITDVGVSMVADLVTVGEARIFREARTQAMETSFSASISHFNFWFSSLDLQIRQYKLFHFYIS